MSKPDINRMIAKAIIEAQASSDSGKGFMPKYTNNRHLMRGPTNRGYKTKVTFILRAISMIASNKSNFSFYVVDAPDQHGHPSIITYFEFQWNGTQNQISFHTPRSEAAPLMRYLYRGRRTTWNMIPCGSHKACQLLAEIYML